MVLRRILGPSLETGAVFDAALSGNYCRIADCVSVRAVQEKCDEKGLGAASGHRNVRCRQFGRAPSAIPLDFARGFGKTGQAFSKSARRAHPRQIGAISFILTSERSQIRVSWFYCLFCNCLPPAGNGLSESSSALALRHNV